MNEERAGRADMRISTPLMLALVFLLAAGCASTAEVARSNAASGQGPLIHVASNGWHTGIIVAREDIPAQTIPEIEDFLRARFFEFSWGDAEYFPAREKGVGLALNAMLRPTPAVMHLAGLPGHPAQVFPSAEIVSLRLTPEGFARLLDFLDRAFDRAKVAESMPGLYSFSRFYPAKGEFHLFNTCNTWTARGLATAGVDVSPKGVVRAEGVMRQLRAAP